jgi:uncharacterized protein YeaO (DUF488 family)
VRKEDFSRKDIYDVWFPNLSPSDTLLRESSFDDTSGWNRFKRKFLAEMKTPMARRDLDLLAVLSHQTDFSVGCYCNEESRCHRSILRELFKGLGADLTRRSYPTD